MLVFSHGSGGLRQQSATIVETVASHGFVVVAADHAGNTAIDRLLGTETDFGVTARNRVLDVVLLLDEVEAGRLAGGLADPDRIAVMGHSFGGFTALAVAGGYDDIAADPRVDAIVPLAPASSRLTDEALRGGRARRRSHGARRLTPAHPRDRGRGSQTLSGHVGWCIPHRV